jgi:hypothetical protein
LYFRNYYFDVYFPALMAHTKSEIANKTREVRDQVHRASRQDTSSNPWRPFAGVCAGALSVLCQAYNLHTKVSIYDIREHALIPIFMWDPTDPGPRFNADKSEWESLHRGGRSLAAGVFNEDKLLQNNLEAAIFFACTIALSRLV